MKETRLLLSSEACDKNEDRIALFSLLETESKKTVISVLLEMPENTSNPIKTREVRKLQ